MIALLTGIYFSGFIIVVVRHNVINHFLCFFIFKTLYNNNMLSGTLVKIFSIIFLGLVAIILILGIRTLFKGGEESKKNSNKLMQLRVLFQFIAVVLLVSFAYFFKN